MDKFGILGISYVYLPPHKRPKNKNEVNFWIMLNDSIKPNRISSITLDNQTGRPENAENLKNMGF